ncbi:aspartate kinase [Myroides sp. LJL119]
MKVFKFGGASLCNAENIKNIKNILSLYSGSKILIVASAMGKTTNALEQVVHNYLHNKDQIQTALQVVKDFHYPIIDQLFNDEKQSVIQDIEQVFNKLNNFLENNKSPNYNFIYDQIVSLGEVISTLILHHYLTLVGITNTWLDAKEVIKTDITYREANVNWQESQQSILNKIDLENLYITQGFIGSDPNGFATTLGREGSDYSAAIFANILQAKSVTIWKDVPGVLNADPRYFEETTLLQRISYQEAIELAFYGASVIHPKTLQPLQNKTIPLHVKSFIDPKAPGTLVSLEYGITPEVPCFIVKKNQLLISLSAKDFSFIMEQNISDIFHLFHLYHMKVHVIQNSAISFSVCLEDKFNNFHQLREKLSASYKVSYNQNVSLYTIRHPNANSADFILKNHTVLLKQVNQKTLQIVTK